MNNNIDPLNSKLEKWFFGFWVKNMRVSFLFMLLIVIAWTFSLYSIPKESSPDIKFGIISISVSYPWVNPVDMDSLITEKIENEIEDIEWIKKITSTSWVWISSISVELDTDAVVRDLLTDIKDKVDNIDLPEDASDPSVVEVSTNNTLIYEALIYWDAEKFDDFSLYKKAKIIKNKLEWNYWVADIQIWWLGDMRMWAGWSSDIDYDIKVLLDKTLIEQLWLSIWDIANIIKINNKDTPIWNFKVWDLSYDFRFQWEFNDIEQLKNIVIRDNWVSKIILSDISEFVLEYPWNEIRRLWSYNLSWQNYISIVVNKSNWANVFDASKQSKEALENLINNEKTFEWLKVWYSKDMSEAIIEDYANLSNTAISTIVLVFITIMFFVWFKEWLIATLLIPLSFLITFIVLDSLWLTLNFLTNFSLVLTLWIAIDTVIVIIEWASEKMKLWYHRRSAIMIAIRDFKAPLISWTLTTLAAFLPLMFLPGIMWKFLSFIPITVFSTLLAALILSLTLSSSLFLKLMWSSKTFHKEEKVEDNLRKSDKELLAKDREWKILKNEETISLREKWLNSLWNFYSKLLSWILKSLFIKINFILIPFVLLILSFVYLSPSIWFTLFPETDEWVINISIKWQSGLDEEYMSKYISVIDESLSKIEEVKNYYVTIKSNSISVYVDLIDKTFRKENKLKTVYEVEKVINKDFEILTSWWLEVSVASLKWWPPSWSAVWIKLSSISANNFDTLKLVSEDFEEYLKTIPYSKNITTSSSDSPWQFVFKFDREKLSNIWLNQNDILSELYFYTNWIKAWSIKSELEENEIRISFKDFENTLSPQDIENIVINTRVWKIRVWDFATFEFKKSVSAITREDWNIIISIWSEVEVGHLPTEVQPILDKFAQEYKFPEWISYLKWWESEENKDLIVSTMKSLVITLFLIFSILVFQFNSFRQPAIILYSIILALLWVNVWLYLTWNPYSMPFWIWFIALTWIVVNDAIILIDKMNKTIMHAEQYSSWEVNYIDQLILAWKSRLQPIIVTTLTTVFWVLPLALQDEFWAWLWFTIIFWLLVWSIMTLIVVPILYHLMVLKNK